MASAYVLTGPLKTTRSWSLD